MAQQVHTPLDVNYKPSLIHLYCHYEEPYLK